MSLIVNKTNYIISNSRQGEFGGPSNYATNLFIDNCLITRVKSTKFLSVIYNRRKLVLEEHINVIANKICLAVNIYFIE